MIIHIILIGYMLLGLNTVCDIYFTGSLEVMVSTWDIKPDVAGATFMAAGGSAPELFTSLIGATITEDDVGFGTIVGSAVFNVLFVIGLCGFAAKEEIALTWWPLFRDCTFYIFGLSLLALFSSDEAIYLWEALFLFMAYLVYCALMYNNTKLESIADTAYINAKKKRFDELAAVVPSKVVSDIGGTGSTSGSTVGNINIPGSCCEAPTAAAPAGTTAANGDPSRPTSKSSGNHETDGDSDRGGSKGEGTNSKSHLPNPAPQLHGKRRASAFLQLKVNERHDQRMASLQEAGVPAPGMTTASMTTATEDAPGGTPLGAEADVEEEECLMDRPEGGLDLCLWILSLPVYVPLYLSIPKPTEKVFMLTFAMALFWIAFFSFFMVWWVEVVGGVLRIPTIIMGFTVLAAGTSIPDAASSVAVARIGEGDMAISSSIGSNIFDILLGLPVPMMIKIGIIESNRTPFKIGSPYITFYVLLLLFMVGAVVISIHMMGWKLNKTLGVMMAVLYLFFLVVAVSVETLEPESLKFSR
jgi:sodium/potassium/calcium exchanger 2